jgi:hypothetical protein
MATVQRVFRWSRESPRPAFHIAWSGHPPPASLEEIGRRAIQPTDENQVRSDRAAIRKPKRAPRLVARPSNLKNLA